jgi:hypothetical protein
VGTGYSLHIAHSRSVKAGRHLLSHKSVCRGYVVRRDHHTQTPLVLTAQLR